MTKFNSVASYPLFTWSEFTKWFMVYKHNAKKCDLGGDEVVFQTVIGKYNTWLKARLIICKIQKSS